MTPPIRTRWLVAALLTLTAVTGLIDAVSYLRLGHVFVANMTGNVVFLGFALAPGSGLSPLASLVAVAGFVVGAAIGGGLARRLERRPRRWLCT
ncbi:MAG TPA: YoaK family protein, partial [Pseudonocardiaceae bacterium]|nr:YoaK family protein [Pseudonocardiaceae bacterium]